MGRINSIGLERKKEIKIDGHRINFENGFGRYDYFREGNIVGLGLIHHPDSSMKCFATLNGQLLGKNIFLINKN